MKTLIDKINYISKLNTLSQIEKDILILCIQGYTLEDVAVDTGIHYMNINRIAYNLKNKEELKEFKKYVI